MLILNFKNMTYTFYFKTETCCSFDYGIMTTENFEQSEISNSHDWMSWDGTLEDLKGYINPNPSNLYSTHINDALIECIEYAENYL